MKRIAVVILTLIVSSCTPAGMMATGPTYTVKVDGMPFKVQRMPYADNSWAANKDNLWGGPVDPANYQRNVRAIEKITGCKVVTSTISNEGLVTRAAVSCKKSKAG